MATDAQLLAELNAVNTRLAQAESQCAYYSSQLIKYESGEFYTRCRELVVNYIEEKNAATSESLAFSDLPITKIARNFFDGCSNLKTLTLPQTLKSIGNSAFRGCYQLGEIHIPSSCTEIGESAFSDCHAATVIELPSIISEIGWGAFYNCNSVKSIVIPEVLNLIPSEAFYGCTSCTEITFKGANLQNISSKAFYDCRSVTSIDLSGQRDLLFYIGSEAFAYCTQLESLLFPTNYKDRFEIGKKAFYECNNLKNLDIPASCTKIESEAFSGCRSLETLIIRGIVSTREGVSPGIEANAFAGCPKTCKVTFENLTYEDCSYSLHRWGFATGTIIKFSDRTITFA